jgi:hypothetical protein
MQTFLKSVSASQTRLKILPVLTREHYTSLLHWEEEEEEGWRNDGGME